MTHNSLDPKCDDVTTNGLASKKSLTLVLRPGQVIVQIKGRA